jgi:hypothetical protein
MKLIKVFILAISIIIFFLIVIDKPSESGNCRHNRIVSKKTIQGVVINKFYDTKSHSNEIIELSNGRNFEWNNNRYKNFDLFNSIQVGDTLKKNKGGLTLFVFSKTQRDTFDLELKCNKKG